MLLLESDCGCSGQPAVSRLIGEGEEDVCQGSGGECTAMPAVRPSSSAGENAAAQLAWVRRVGKAGSVAGNPVVPAVCTCLCAVTSNTLSAVVGAAVACVSLPVVSAASGNATDRVSAPSRCGRASGRVARLGLL